MAASSKFTPASLEWAREMAAETLADTSVFGTIDLVEHMLDAHKDIDDLDSNHAKYVQNFCTATFAAKNVGGRCGTGSASGTSSSAFFEYEQQRKNDGTGSSVAKDSASAGAPKGKDSKARSTMTNNTAFTIFGATNKDDFYTTKLFSQYDEELSFSNSKTNLELEVDVKTSIEA